MRSVGGSFMCDYECEYAIWFGRLLRRYITSRTSTNSGASLGCEIHSGDWWNRVYTSRAWVVSNGSWQVSSDITLFNSADKEVSQSLRGDEYESEVKKQEMLDKFISYVDIAGAVFGRENVTIRGGFKKCAACGYIGHFEDYTSDLCERCLDLAKQKAESVPTGHVYVYEAINMGFYKIGRTWDLNQRHKALVKLPFEIRQILALETNDPVGLEKRLHSAYHNKRVNGEWFKLSECDLSGIVEIAEALGEKIPSSGDTVGVRTK